jgi:sialidase-1
MASLCRLSEKGKHDRDRLLFANPDNLLRFGKVVRPGSMADRKKLTVKLSYDEGKTWRVARVLEPGFSGYSDLAVGPDGTIYCFYERGSTDGKDIFATRYLTVARFNLEWLTNGKDSLRGALTGRSAWAGVAPAGRGSSPNPPPRPTAAAHGASV